MLPEQKMLALHLLCNPTAQDDQSKVRIEDESVRLLAHIRLALTDWEACPREEWQVKQSIVDLVQATIDLRLPGKPHSWQNRKRVELYETSLRRLIEEIQTGAFVSTPLDIHAIMTKTHRDIYLLYIM
jgi:hypothetical protein